MLAAKIAIQIARCQCESAVMMANPTKPKPPRLVAKTHPGMKLGTSAGQIRNGMAARERKERIEKRSMDGRRKTTDHASPSQSGRLSLRSLRSLRPSSVFRFVRRCSTRFALALPALPATLCHKEHRIRMACTKSNGNDSAKFSASLGINGDARSTRRKFEVWSAEDPDHIIHFNGERFLGPYPDVLPPTSRF